MKISIGKWLFNKYSLYGLVACVLQSVSAAQAASDGPDQSRIVEATLFAGRAFGGSFDNMDTGRSVSIESANGLGVALNVESSEANGFYELSYFREKTSLGDAVPFNVSIEYLHVGGYATFTDDPKRIATYFLLTVGGTRFTPDQAAFETPLAFSLAAGSGIKFPLSEHFLLRLDGRLYVTLLNGDTDLFCALPAVGCAIHLQGNTLLRGVVSLGATYRF